MRFKIGDRIYTAAAVDRLSLRNLLRLEQEAAELGRPMRWAEMRAMAQRVQALPAAEVEADDDFPWFLGMLIWAARLEAGEEISFMDAIDFPLGDLDIVPDPEDHKAPADPRQARPASGRAGAGRGAAARSGASRKTSARRSSDD